MKHYKPEYSLEEAIYTLSAYGLEEFQEVLKLDDDAVLEILLNDIPPKWEQKIMEWFNNYLINQAIDLKSEH